VVLHTLVPAGLIAAVPVGVLTGGAAPLAAGVAGVALAVALTGLHWRLALRRYDGAG
jgi:ABC-2 type transport system permease protein